MPLTPYFFDILHLDGHDLLGLDSTERHEWLSTLVPEERRIPRFVTEDAEAGEAFFTDAVKRGHEGVMVKSLDRAVRGRPPGFRLGQGEADTHPRPGGARRGVGPRAPTGWLSNLHLGARERGAGEFVMLGKTFKGLTDELLRWQTERFQELEVSRDDFTVYLRPEIVVEVAFDGVQTSTRYPGGMALRFARVLRYREDKTAQQVDTVQSVRAIHQPSEGPADA